LAGSAVGGAAGDLPRIRPPAALAVLREAAAAVRGRQVTAVFVTGVAGAGKSSLLKSARAELASQEGAVLFAAGRQRPWLEWFGADHLALHGLCRRAVAMLADGPLTIMLDDAHECDPLVLRWVDALLRRVAGQPLFVVLAHDPDAASPVRELLTTVTGHPEGVVLELAPVEPAPVRVDRLPGGARKVATGIAVLGVSEPRLIARLLELPVPEVEAGTDILRRHGLLPWDGPTLDRAVLEGVPSTELDMLRLRGARVLHDAGAAPARVAHLLVDLPDLDELWMYHVLWDAAITMGRHEAPFVNRVLRAASGHAETLVELVAVMSGADPEAATEHLRHAVERATDPRTRALLAHRLGALSLRTRQAGTVFPLLCDVLDTLGGHVDNEVHRRLESVMLGVGLHSASTVPATLRRARTTPVPAGDTPAGRSTLGMLAATTMMDGGSAARAAELARAATAASVVLHNGPVLAAARILDRAGLPEEALATLDRIVATSRRDGAVRTHCHALASRAAVAAGMGRCAEADADAETAMELGRDKDWTAPRTAFAAVLVDRGEPARAVAVLDEVGEPNFVWEHHEVYLVRARARFLLDDADGALSLLLRCGRSLAEAGIRSPMLAPWWLPAAVVLAEQGRHAEARPLVEAQTESLIRWGTPESVGLSQLATGIATRGRRGLDLMVAAVERLAESPAPLSQLRAELCLGRALLRAGDDAGARKHLHRAVDLAVRCGHAMFRSAATGLLTAAGGRVRRPVGASSGLLTAAERRVAAHAAVGTANREIARELFISVRTVETHLSNVYRKLGVSSREEITPALREIATSARATETTATSGRLPSEREAVHNGWT
jgi:DNA-binding CsgD family transcriptional regulator